MTDDTWSQDNETEETPSVSPSEGTDAPVTPSPEEEVTPSQPTENNEGLGQ